MSPRDARHILRERYCAGSKRPPWLAQRPPFQDRPGPWPCSGGALLFRRAPMAPPDEPLAPNLREARGDDNLAPRRRPPGRSALLSVRCKRGTPGPQDAPRGCAQPPLGAPCTARVWQDSQWRQYETATASETAGDSGSASAPRVGQLTGALRPSESDSSDALPRSWSSCLMGAGKARFGAKRYPDCYPRPFHGFGVIATYCIHAYYPD